MVPGLRPWVVARRLPASSSIRMTYSLAGSSTPSRHESSLERKLRVCNHLGVVEALSRLGPYRARFTQVNESAWVMSGLEAALESRNVRRHGARQDFPCHPHTLAGLVAVDVPIVTVAVHIVTVGVHNVAVTPPHQCGRSSTLIRSPLHNVAVTPPYRSGRSSTLIRSPFHNVPVAPPYRCGRPSTSMRSPLDNVPVTRSTLIR